MSTIRLARILNTAISFFSKKAAGARKGILLAVMGACAWGAWGDKSWPTDYPGGDVDLTTKDEKITLTADTTIPTLAIHATGVVIDLAGKTLSVTNFNLGGVKDEGGTTEASITITDSSTNKTGLLVIDVYDTANNKSTSFVLGDGASVKITGACWVNVNTSITTSIGGEGSFDVSSATSGSDSNLINSRVESSNITVIDENTTPDAVSTNTYYWTGKTNSSWTESTNWAANAGGGIPVAAGTFPCYGNADTAIFTNGAEPSISVSLPDDTESITVINTSNSIVTIDFINNGFSVTNATTTFTGNFTFKGKFTAASAASNGTYFLNGNVDLSDCTFTHNDGTVYFYNMTSGETEFKTPNSSSFNIFYFGGNVKLNVTDSLSCSVFNMQALGDDYQQDSDFTASVIGGSLTVDTCHLYRCDNDASSSVRGTLSIENSEFKPTSLLFMHSGTDFMIGSGSSDTTVTLSAFTDYSANERKNTITVKNGGKLKPNAFGLGVNSELTIKSGGVFESLGVVASSTDNTSQIINEGSFTTYSNLTGVSTLINKGSGSFTVTGAIGSESAKISTITNEAGTMTADSVYASSLTNYATLTASSGLTANSIFSNNWIKTANLTADDFKAGTADARAGKLEITGNGRLSITNPDDPTSWLYDVVIDSGKTLTLENDITVYGNWTNNNETGGLDSNSKTITFAGEDMTVSGSQTFANAVFSGSGTEITGANTFSTVTFNADTSISGNNTFTNFICETGGATLTFGTGKTQTVTGNLTLKGADSNRLTLASSSDSSIVVPVGNLVADYLSIGENVVIRAGSSVLFGSHKAYSGSEKTSIPTATGGTEKLNYFALYKNGWDLGYDFVYEWVGADENWSNDSNWDLGLAPGITSKQTTGAKVLIPDGLEKYPSVDVDGVSLTSLVIGTSTESPHDSSIKLTLNALTVTDSLENYGTVNYGGSGRITDGDTTPSPTNDVSHGGTVEYSGSGQTVTDFGETDYANLVISGTAESGGNLVVSENLTVGAGASLSQKHNLNLAGNLSIGDTSSFEVDSGKTVLFDGSLEPTISISSNATKAEFSNLEIGENSSVSTESSFTVSGNWTNSGSFSATGGTITFTGENALISGNSTFKNFTCEADGATLTFADNTTQTVTGNLVLKGASGSPLTLSSSNVCYIDVNHENLTADFLSIGSKIIIMEDSLPVNGSHDAIDSEPSSGTSQNNYLALYKNGWNLGYEFTFTWTGDDSSIPMSWNAKENWDIGMIPGQTSNESPASKVVIPSGLVYYPVLDEPTSGIDSLYIKSLKIESGASLKLLSTNLAVTDENGNHQFENSGTIEFAGDARITDGDTTPSSINDVSHGGTVIYSGGTAESPQSVTDFGTTDYANLVISGTAESGGELSVSGEVSVGAGGSLSAGENGVISVAGSFENSGTFTGSNGSITISGDYLGTGGTFTGSTGNVTITGDYSETGGSFKASSGTTSFAGNVDLSGTTFSANGGTVAFNGTGSQTLTAKTDGSTTFNIVVISENSSVSTASSFTVAGNWSNGNTSGIGFSATGGTIIFTGEEVTITGNNTFTNFTCETNGSLLSIGGTQKITGNLTLTGGEDTFLSLVGNGKFVVTGGSSSFEGKNLSIGSDVKIQKDSGTLIAGAFVVTKSSPASPDIAAIISNGWKFEAVSFTWLGTDPSSPTDWATPANWNPALVPGSANFEDSLVNIPGGISNYPNVGNFEYKISSLKIGSESLTGAKIVLGTVDLTVTNKLENYGTINYGGSGRITDGGTTPSPINDTAHGGTVEYSGGVAGSPQPVTDFGETDYANLVISGIAESDGNLVVSGNLTLESGGSLSQRHNLNLAGNLSIGGSSSFAVDSGKTVLFDGSLGQIISVSSNATKVEFANLEIGINSSVSTESSFTVTGNWSNNNTSGSGFSASGGTITCTGENAILGGNQTFANAVFSGANATLSGNNTFTTATFSATTTLSGNNTFTDFTCTTGGITLTVDGTQTVSGRLSLSGSSEAGNLLTVTGTGSFDSSTDDGRYIGTYLSIGNGIKIKNNSALTPRTFVATNSSIVDSATLASVVANGWKFNGLSYKWVGTTVDWNTASNWDIGIVPDSTASVTYDLNAVAQPVFGDDVSIENITIPAGKSLSLNGHHFSVSGDFSNSGTIILTGTENVLLPSDVLKITENGTWHYSGTGSGIVKPIDNLDYENLVISGTIGVEEGYTITASDGITIGTTTESAAISSLEAVHFGSAVTVAGDSMITSSTDKNILFSSDVMIAPSKTLSFGGTNDDYSVSISGDFTNSGTLVPNKSTVSFAGTSQTITADSATTFCNVQIEENSSLSTESSFMVSGNWTNNGTFTATAGTITFKGENATLSGDNIFSTAAFSASTTVSGSNSFTDFICETGGVILTFGDGKTQTVNGNFTVAGGSSENPVTLQSSISGKEWTISAPVGTSSVSFAKIKDSVSVNDSILAENSLDEGNNTFWNFKGFEYTWNGAADSDWQKKSNWSPASVPGKLANATIPDSNATSIISNYPAINVATEIANLTIGTQSAETHTASVKLDSSLSENFKVSGTFSNYGTIEYAGSARITDGIKPINDAANDGTVVYSGGTTETPQIVTDFGETDYAKLVIRGSVSEKSDADYKFVSLVHIETGDKILLSGANVFAGGVAVTGSGSSVTLNASENYDLDLSGESDVAVCKNLDLTGAGVVTAKSDITVSENLTNASTLSLDGHALSFGSYTGETDGSDSVVLDGNTLTAIGLAGTIGRLESSGSSTLNNTGNGALTLSSFVKSGDMAGTLALNGGTSGITISSATYGGTVITGTGKLTLAGTTDSDSMGNLTVGDGTTAGNVSVGGALKAADLSVNAGSLTLGGDTNLSSVTIASNAVLKAGESENSSNKINVGGNWTNNAGTSGFVAQKGAVTFTGSDVSVSGGNTFNDVSFSTGGAAVTFADENAFASLSFLGAGTTANFAAGKTQTVNRNLTLKGESENLITLTGENEWEIKPSDNSEISVAYTKIVNSNNTRETPIIVYAKGGYNVDGTGNTNWIFAGQEYVWTGADENSPTEWNSSENWNPKSVPTKYSDVKINAVFSKKYPVLTSDVDLANDSLSLTVDLYGDGTPESVSITSSVAISENVIFDFNGKSLTVNSLTSEGRIRVSGNEKLEASGKSGIVNFPVDENFVITGIIEYYGNFGTALNWGSKFTELEFTSGATGSENCAISVIGTTSIANGPSNAITLTGANTFGGAVTIGDAGTAAGDITLSGGNTFTGGVSIVSGGAIVIKGEKDSGNPMEFLGTSSCGELTVESGVVLNGNISTEGSQIYKGDVVSASGVVLDSNSSYILAGGNADRKWRVKNGGTLRFASDVFIDISSASLSFETDLVFEKNLVLYSGKVLADNVNLSIKKDFVLFGSSYSASDPRFSGTNTRFAYYGYEYSESPLAYKPEAGTSGFAGEFDTNGTKISVGGNFYANGLDLADCNFSLLDNSASSPVFNSSSSVTKDQWGLPYAVVFNSTVSNCKAQASGGSVFVTAAAYQGVIDGSNNSGFQFNIPKISGAYSVSDSVICLSFDMDLENSNREVQTAVAMVTSLMDGGIFYNGGTVAFDGFFYTKTDGTDCSVPLSESAWASSDIPAGTPLYLKVSSPANTWNTDATASSKGNDDSSDRSGAHRTNTIDLSLFEGLFYAADGKTMSRNYGVGLWKEESESSYSTAKAFPTIDKARPVLVDVFTGQELHSTNIGSAESQKVYDSHNFIEFRYSEPVDIGDMTSGAETDNQNIRAEKDFDSASSHGGAISKNETGLSVAGFASIAEGSLTAGFRDDDSHKTDSAKPHALYRKFSRSAISSEEVQPCRIRISVAGFVDTENPYTIDGKSFNNWVGYIDSSESPAGHVTPVANPYIYDLAKDSDGNLLKNTLDDKNSSREIEVNSVSSSIDSDCVPGALSSLYGSWDCTPPSFAPYITSTEGSGSTSWIEGDSDTRTYEIVGMVESNTSAYLEHVEFHLFDNQPEYKASEVYKWVSQSGWSENGSKLDNHLAPETSGGGKPYSNGSNMTSGGIRRSSLSGAREAFEYSYSTDESHSSYREFGNGEIFQHVKSSLYRSEEKTSTSTDDDGLYIALYLNEKDVKLPMRTSFTVKYHPEKSFITDLAGNRLIQTDDGSSVKTLHSVDITPPSFSIVLSPIGEKKIYMVFTKALAYNGVLLQNQSNLDSVLEKIRSNIEFVYSEDDDIDTTKTLSGDDVIEIEKVELASYSTDYTSLLFTLDRNISLNDVEKIWLRINGEGDEVETFAGKIIASYFRDTTENSIPFHTCHSISDFAVNAVNVLYARSSSDDGWDEHEIYGAGLAPTSSDYAAHDFSADGANYAKLRSGHDIIFQLQLVGGVNSDGKYGFKNNEGLSLVIDRKSDLKNEWISDKFNFLTQKDWRIWLDSKLLSLATSYNPYPLSGTPEFEKVSGSELLENMTIKNSDYNFVNKEEYQFFFKILGEDGNPIELDHDGDKTTPKIPLYSFWMPQDKISSGDYSFLDLWSFSISSITQQRGGVTILNNVINAGIGEKTAIEVEMPSSGNLNVFIMTLDGNIVQHLAKGSFKAGKHYFYWDGKNKGGSPVARGLYFVRVSGKGIDETRKVMVVK